MLKLRKAKITKISIMSKNKLKIIAGLALIVFLFAGLWLWSSKTRKVSESYDATPITSDILFFYGQECPHCIETEKFLAENKIAEKVKFDSLEVWYNKKNATLLQEKAVECGLKKEEIGVPFLYAKGQCLIGSPDIEKFFQDEAANK
jgi:glutaredoxin